MSKGELRYSISSEQYLERNYVMVYLEDAMSQLLEHKDDTAKLNVSKFFANYFASVKDGTHVLLREYSFVRATPHNRSSFVHLCWKTFSNIARKIELMNMYEYHSLLSLICPNIPMSIVQQTARIVLVDDSLDCLMPFTDFIYAFQLRLCYDEFLNKCGEAYKSLMQNRALNLEAVVVPTSEGRPLTASAAHGGSSAAGDASAGRNGSNDGIDSLLYHRSLVGICEKFDSVLHDFLLPPDVLKAVLSAAPRITYYGFLNALAKAPAVNDHVGKLPTRSELLTTFEPEMATKMCTPPPAQPTDVITPIRDTAARTPPGCSTSANMETLPPVTSASTPNVRTTRSNQAAGQPRPGSSTGNSASGRRPPSLVSPCTPPPRSHTDLDSGRHHHNRHYQPLSQRSSSAAAAAAAAAESSCGATRSMKLRLRCLEISDSDDTDIDDDDIDDDDDDNTLSLTT